jgi:hypothetical protein
LLTGLVTADQHESQPNVVENGKGSVQQKESSVFTAIVLGESIKISMLAAPQQKHQSLRRGNIFCRAAKGVIGFYCNRTYSGVNQISMYAAPQQKHQVAVQQYF